MKNLFLLFGCLLTWASFAFAQTDDYKFNLEVEGGALKFTRNDVRDPGDIGTQFKFSALNAIGPTGYVRVYAEAKISERNTLRFLYAPLQVSGTGTLPTRTFFENATFAAGVPTKGTYKFNNYRATWRYTLKIVSVGRFKPAQACWFVMRKLNCNKAPCALPILI